MLLQLIVIIGVRNASDFSCIIIMIKAVILKASRHLSQGHARRRAPSRPQVLGWIALSGWSLWAQEAMEAPHRR